MINCCIVPAAFRVTIYELRVTDIELRVSLPVTGYCLFPFPSFHFPVSIFYSRLSTLRTLQTFDLLIPQ